MTSAQLKKLEDDLWEAADQLRANSKLTSTEYYMPVLGVIFLRHATNRFNAAHEEIQRTVTHREPVLADYVKRRALFLPEEARYDWIASRPDGTDRGKLLNAAMTAIEESFEPLANVLPKDYGIFDSDLLEELLSIFNRDSLRAASGDVFGRIYEYFLMKFAMQGAQDAGEFFTPPSIVQLIVNVIEPDHGKVLDPACGSGGMFVQSSHFIEQEGKDTAASVSFFGQEKTAATIRLAKMNLAVHGLEGEILEANTFYEDQHDLRGGADFVMANPPFNVDMVDAERIEGDPRLPFGLPGVNKKKHVSNGNYLWASYFYSYLNDTGRAGFVMSSQASSAGRGEAEVRRRIVETGHVDVMIAIRGGFFYTRQVPCELWFYDKGKPEERADTVLMLDARNVHRKMSRTVYEFAPEQLDNLTAIVWLYRGETERFDALTKSYADRCRERRRELAVAADTARDALALIEVETMRLYESEHPYFDPDFKETLAPADAAARDLRMTLDELASEILHRDYTEDPESLPDLAQRCRKLRTPVQEVKRRLGPLLKAVVKFEKDKKQHPGWRNRFAELETALDTLIEAAAENERLTRHAVWLRDRFPDGVYADVEGLCKAVTRAEIAENDGSLTPGRYVGVAPEEDDPDFDFDARMTEIHAELGELNAKAAELAAAIQRNWEEVKG